MGEKLRIEGFDSLVSGVVSLKSKYEKYFLYISCFSLAISFLSVGIAYYSYSIVKEWKYGSGIFEPLKPSGYFVIRGVEFYKHPSDHLVLPIEWLNTGGKDVVVTNIKIELTSANNNSNKITFILAGQYDNCLIKGDGAYEIRKNLIVKPHSVSPTVLIFHIERWWDKCDQEKYNFRFKPDEIYEVKILFNKDSNTELTTTCLFNKMKIFSSIQNLQLYGVPFWDYWDRESW